MRTGRTRCWIRGRFTLPSRHDAFAAATLWLIRTNQQLQVTAMNVDLKFVKCGALLFLAVCAETPAAFAENPQVKLAAVCNSYSMQDSIELSAAVVNASRTPMTIYGKLGWGWLGGLRLVIADQDGKIVEPEFLDHDMPIPSTFDDRGYYVTLQEGHSLGTTRRDGVGQLFPSPGTYTLRLIYRSPISRKLDPLVKDMVVSEDGESVSDPTTIVVTREGKRCSDR